jgi:hypothetical protein
MVWAVRSAWWRRVQDCLVDASRASDDAYGPVQPWVRRSRSICVARTSAQCRGSSPRDSMIAGRARRAGAGPAGSAARRAGGRPDRTSARAPGRAGRPCPHGPARTLSRAAPGVLRAGGGNRVHRPARRGLADARPGRTRWPTGAGERRRAPAATSSHSGPSTDRPPLLRRHRLRFPPAPCLSGRGLHLGEGLPLPILLALLVGAARDVPGEPRAYSACAPAPGCYPPAARGTRRQGRERTDP